MGKVRGEPRQTWLQWNRRLLEQNSLLYEELPDIKCLMNFKYVYQPFICWYVWNKYCNAAASVIADYEFIVQPEIRPTEEVSVQDQDLTSPLCFFRSQIAQSDVRAWCPFHGFSWKCLVNVRSGAHSIVTWIIKLIWQPLKGEYFYVDKVHILVGYMGVSHV